MEPSDEALLTRLAGDREAVAEFYRRHVERVLSFAARRVRTPEDAADLTSAVFLALLETSDRFDPRRGSGVAVRGRHPGADERIEERILAAARMRLSRARRRLRAALEPEPPATAATPPVAGLHKERA